MSQTPLTILSEEEQMFQDAIAGFAKDRIGPLVSEMDEGAKISPALIEQLFEMGLMGIEIPEKYQGWGDVFLFDSRHRSPRCC